MQDSSNSIANSLELLQSCTKPLIYTFDDYLDITYKLVIYDLNIKPSNTWWDKPIWWWKCNGVEYKDNMAAADALVPCITRSSATTQLTTQGIGPTAY